ncbi:MAG: hypothetical protein CSA62_14690 [Planctomycetota bacterium]|nr:MAG: hypothetical protein CSA62_14690 [Planctomycetota bacterium]
MNDRAKNTLLVVLGLGLAFSVGQRFGTARAHSGHELAAGPNLAVPLTPEPQGRRVGGNSQKPQPPVTGTGAPSQPGPLVWESGGGSSGAAGGIIAVTGSYGVGTSVLYVVDAKNRQLAVYEARGGSRGSRRLVLVGARKIDLDLQLEGYRDESEHSYDQLRKMFEKRGLIPAGGASKGVSAPTQRGSVGAGR